MSMYLVELCLRLPRLASQEREPAWYCFGRWMVKPRFTSNEISVPSTFTSSGGNSRCRVTLALGFVTWQGRTVGQLVRSWMTS